MSRLRVCTCASCAGLAPDDDERDDEAAAKRCDALDDEADARFEAAREREDERLAEEP